YADSNDIIKDQDDKYIAYWLNENAESVRAMISDRRVLAGLDAYQKGFLSHGGFMERVYGDRSRVLFPGFSWYWSLPALEILVGKLKGEDKIPSNLEEEFPEFYEFYDPEAFGSDGV